MVSNPFGGDPLVVEVTSETEGLESGLAGAMGQLDSLKGAVAGLGLALAGLSAGGLASAVNSAANFESQLVELEKVTDPTTAREMGTAIQDMASRMPLAQSELAGIAEQAGRLGIEGTDNIQNFTEVTAEMATATDLTAEEAADSFARMSTLMNEPIENVRAIGDATNALSNSMATSSSEITDAATRSSGALTNMGMKSSDILALNAAMNEVSPSARVAGTQLRRMAQEMMDPGKIDDLAAALGMSVSEFKAMRKEDPTQVIRMMAEQMGEGGEAARRLRSTLSTTSRQALAGLSNNLDSMNKGLEVSEQQFKEGGSLAAEFESAMGTFQNTVQITRNNLRNLAISTGQLLLPALTEAMRAVNSLVNRFSSLNEASGGVIGVATLLTGLFGGLGLAGWQVVSMMGGLSAALAPVYAGFSALGSAISVLLGPVGILIGVVAALGYAWSTNFAGIRDATMRVVGAIKSQFIRIIQVAQAVIGPILTDLMEAFSGFGGGTESVISRIVTAVEEWLLGAIMAAGDFIVRTLISMQEWWAQHGDTVISTIQRIVQGFVRFGNAVQQAVTVIWQDYLQPFIEWFVPIAQDVLVATLNLVGKAWDALKTAVSTAVSVIWNDILQPFIAWFVPIWEETMGPVVEEAAKTWSVWSQIVTYTINTIRKNINAFLTWLEPYWNAYWKEFNANFQVFMSDMQAIWDLVGDDLIATAQFVWDFISSIIKGALTIISGILQTVMAVARADWATAWDIIKQTVVDVVSGIGAFVLKWGYRFVYRIGEIVLGVIDWFITLGQRLIGGSIIPDMLSDIKSAFSSFGRDVVRWISNFVGNFAHRIQNWASRVNTAFWNGLDRMYRALGRAGRQLIGRMGSIASDVVQEVKDIGSNMYNAGRNIIQSIVNGIKSKGNAVKNAVADHVGKAAKFLPWSDAEEGPLSNLSESGPGFVRTVAQGIRSEGGRMVAAVAEMASAAANSLTEAAQGALGGNLQDAIVQSARVEVAGGDTGGPQMNQNQTPNITAQFDSLAQSNRQAIQRLEGEMAQRLDTLISNEGEMAQRLDTLIAQAKSSEGVVRIDGKRAGTLIEGSMHRKQYSTEIRE